jgi:hypothetical protein
VLILMRLYVQLARHITTRTDMELSYNSRSIAKNP